MPCHYGWLCDPTFISEMKTEVIWIGILEVLLLSYFKIFKKTTRAGIYSIYAFAFFFFFLLEGEFETGTLSFNPKSTSSKREAT